LHRPPVGCHTRILRRSHRTEAERHTTLVATHREPRSYRLPRSATQSRDKTGRNFGLGRSARDGCSPEGVVVLCSPALYGLRGGAAGAATQAVDWLEVWLGDAPNPGR